jgi:hypothetical protein
MRRTMRLSLLLSLLGGSLAAHAATTPKDKLEGVKTGKARETSPKDLAEPIDGLRTATVAELKTYCTNLKKERVEAEKDVSDRVMAARIADGTFPDVAKMRAASKGDIREAPPVVDPKVASKTPEAQAAKVAVAESLVRRTTLGCLLYATSEVQKGRAKQKVPTTNELLKSCNEARAVPPVNAIECDGEPEQKAPEPKKEK